MAKKYLKSFLYYDIIGCNTSKRKWSNLLKKIFLIITLLLSTYMFGCSSNKPNDEKQLIGFTIYEKNTQIGKSQKVNNLNDITNGFYTTRDHTATSFIGESYFNIKIDTSILPGDLITPESNCLFVNASYYQAYTVNYKLFIYEIYRLNEGGYSIEYKDEIQLSPILGESKTITSTFESLQNSLNYVFTYKITISKIATPLKSIIREFDKNNKLINEIDVTEDLSEYQISDKTAYTIIEDRNSYINDEGEEIITSDYTLITENSTKSTYGFKALNKDNRIITFQVSFKFPEKN